MPPPPGMKDVLTALPHSWTKNWLFVVVNDICRRICEFKLFRDLCTLLNLREHRVQLKIDGRYPIVHEQWRANIEICGFKAHWA